MRMALNYAVCLRGSTQAQNVVQDTAKIKQKICFTAALVKKMVKKSIPLQA